MADMERELRRALAGDKLDAARHEALREEVRRMYDRRMTTVKVVTWVGHVLFLGMLVGGIWLVVCGPGMAARLLGVIIALMGDSGLVLIKLWYWVVNAKYSVLTEVKALEVQVAAIAERLPPKNP